MERMESPVAQHKRKPRRPKNDGVQQQQFPSGGGRTRRPAVHRPDSRRRTSSYTPTKNDSRQHPAKSGSSSSKRKAVAAVVHKKTISKTKKKFQKPKHLKRKLDATHDETEKKEIIVQLESLEMKKKKQKLTRTSSNNDSNGPLQSRSNQETRSTRGTVVRNDGLVGQHADDISTKHHNDNDFVETAAIVPDAPRRHRRRGRKDTTKVGERVLDPHDNEESKCENRDRINRRTVTRKSDDSVRIIEKMNDTPETTVRTKPISTVACSENRNEDIEENREEAPMKETATEKISLVADNNESSKEHENGSSDSESSTDDTPLRQRGRKRRGRKDTSQIIQEQIPELKDDQNQEEVDDKSSKQKDRDRRCIGRKPLTDFEVGQSYSGTVVYTKPFGIFLDIGCHSDAFCHVSRLGDDYVESPDTLFRPGDHVEAARVVEVDRLKKRITVSLQSKARLEDEQASKDARQDRRDKQKRKNKKSKAPTAFEKLKPDKASTKPNFLASAVNDVEHSALAEPISRSQISSNSACAISKSEIRSEKALVKSESEMSPAELKRWRKLARRAARRADEDEKLTQ